MSDIEALTASENENKAEVEAKHVAYILNWLLQLLFNQMNYI